MTQIKPLQGKPALLISGKKKILCIADLHLGYELELKESGFNIPDQTMKIAESIIDIDEGDHLLILGDVKHTIPYTTKFEFIGILRFFRPLRERFSSITIVTGNHDGALRESVPEEIEIISSKGTTRDAIGLAHGHSWPSDDVMGSEKLIMGHIHPSIRLRDRLGSGSVIKCWLRGTVNKDKTKKRYKRIGIKEAVIMPAYNHLLTGSPVNEKSDYDLSPMIRSGFISMAEQEVYTLDGVKLGAVSSLMVKRSR